MNYKTPFSDLNNKVVSYLLIFIPISLITGPFLSDLSVTIISLITLYHILRNKDFEIFKNLLIKIFFLFWINSTIITLYNYFKGDILLETSSLFNSLGYLRFIFFTIGFAKILSENKKIFSFLFYSLGICFFFLIIDSYIQLIFNENILNNAKHVSGRISSFFGDELIMGSYIVKLLFIFLGLYFFLDFKKKSTKIFFNSLIFLVSTIIFLSGERSAIILLLIGFVTTLGIIRFPIKKVIFSFFLLFLTILILLNVDSDLKKRFVDKTLFESGISSTQTHQILNGVKYTFFTQQINYYLTSYNIFKDNYFGTGNRSFSKVCKKYRADKSFHYDFNFSKKERPTQSCSTHPHNTYMQVLAENGFLGFFILIAIFFIICYLLINQFYLRLKGKILYPKLINLNLITIFLNFFPLIQTGNFFNNWLSILYYIPIGFFLYFLNEKKFQNN